MRELKYSSAAEMSEAIDKYFEDCDGHPMTDETGDIVVDKYGNPIIIGAHPPTVTGLALWLGFKTRQSLLDYQPRNKAVKDVLKSAKSRGEEYAERRLYDRDGVNGAKFSLKSNFKGWSETPNSSDENALAKLDEVLKQIGG